MTNDMSRGAVHKKLFPQKNQARFRKIVPCLIFRRDFHNNLIILRQNISPLNDKFSPVLFWLTVYMMVSSLSRQGMRHSYDTTVYQSVYIVINFLMSNMFSDLT